MLPISEYLAIAKDLAIVIAIAALVYFVYHSGANSVRVADIQAMQKQIEANAKTQERYHSEITDAFAEANSQMGNLAHSIDANHKPVIVRVPASGSAVPGTPASPPSTGPFSGGGDATPGVDIRPQLNAYEKWLEERFGQCRALKESWPK